MRTHLSLGLGLVLGLTVSGFVGVPATAGDEPVKVAPRPGRGSSSNRPAPLLVNGRARREILEIVRDAGHREHHVRTNAIKAWYARPRRGAFSPLVTGLTFRSPRSRAFAAWALARQADPRAIEPLSRRALHDTSALVRRTAVDAIRAIGAAHPDQDGTRPLARATRSGRHEVRIRAVHALGVLGTRDRRAVGHLIRTLEIVGGPGPRVNLFSGRQNAYIQGYDVDVARGAVIARPRVGVVTEGTVLDARVVRTRQRSRLFVRVVVETLMRCTGRDFGDDACAWRTWFETTKKRTGHGVPAFRNATAPVGH